MTRRVKLYIDHSGWVQLETPYNNRFRTTLLSSLPFESRRFDKQLGEAGRWKIAEAQLPRVMDLLVQFGLELDRVEVQAPTKPTVTPEVVADPAPHAPGTNTPKLDMPNW